MEPSSSSRSETDAKWTGRGERRRRRARADESRSAHASHLGQPHVILVALFEPQVSVQPLRAKVKVGPLAAPLDARAFAAIRGALLRRLSRGGRRRPPRASLFPVSERCVSHQERLDGVSHGGVHGRLGGLADGLSGLVVDLARESPSARGAILHDEEEELVELAMEGADVAGAVGVGDAIGGLERRLGVGFGLLELALGVDELLRELLQEASAARLGPLAVLRLPRRGSGITQGRRSTIMLAYRGRSASWTFTGRVDGPLLRPRAAREAAATAALIAEEEGEGVASAPRAIGPPRRDSTAAVSAPRGTADATRRARSPSARNIARRADGRDGRERARARAL